MDKPLKYVCPPRGGDRSAVETTLRKLDSVPTSQRIFSRNGKVVACMGQKNTRPFSGIHNFIKKLYTKDYKRPRGVGGSKPSTQMKFGSKVDSLCKAYIWNTSTTRKTCREAPSGTAENIVYLMMSGLKDSGLIPVSAQFPVCWRDISMGTHLDMVCLDNEDLSVVVVEVKCHSFSWSDIETDLGSKDMFRVGRMGPQLVHGPLAHARVQGHIGAEMLSMAMKQPVGSAVVMCDCHGKVRVYRERDQTPSLCGHSVKSHYEEVALDDHLAKYRERRAKQKRRTDSRKTKQALDDKISPHRKIIAMTREDSKRVKQLLVDVRSKIKTMGPVKTLDETQRVEYDTLIAKRKKLLVKQRRLEEDARESRLHIKHIKLGQDA